MKRSCTRGDKITRKWVSIKKKIKNIKKEGNEKISKGKKMAQERERRKKKMNKEERRSGEDIKMLEC